MRPTSLAGSHFAVVAAIAVGVTIAGCRVHALRHNQHVAGAKAAGFLRLAVVEQKLEEAHAMVSNEYRQAFSKADLATAISMTHPTGYPISVSATEYEPVPGQPAIQIFLIGESSQEKFFYRVPLSGTVDTGYSPTGLFRGNQPYPPSQLRQPLKKQ